MDSNIAIYTDGSKQEEVSAAFVVLSESIKFINYFKRKHVWKTTNQSSTELYGL